MKIHLGNYSEDSARFQWLNGENKSVADCLMSLSGEVIESRPFGQSEYQMSLFVAGCRNILLNREAFADAIMEASSLVSIQRKEIEARNAQYRALYQS